ncbi:hypothetical protein NPX13_g2663 [Xylaria arbuscula]|uniref:Uncharacterized protein n=1 Tax=Xylaria arbuscula TaxID=114810 RepID=A0A9W8NKA1_9PEZI|nr:hypothetical protein NPX13_g2663 [Xylaria arbuscula]
MSRTSPSIQQLLDTLYNQPDILTRRLHDIPLTGLIEMEVTHHLVKDFADAFASDAWSLLLSHSPFQGQGRSDSFVLSPMEQFRFYRAFYRVELFLRLFRGDSTQLWSFLEDEQVGIFLSRHPPWVNEQLGCVHDYIEKRFSQASHDVLAHDIEFGELNIDYITNGPDNQWKQGWISQGLRFTLKLEQATSHDERAALLSSTLVSGHVKLHEALTKSCESDDENYEILENYSKEEIKTLEPRHDSEEEDGWPFLAWKLGHDHLPREGWVLMTDNAVLRRCAYVLWDTDRIQRYNMVPTLNKLSFLYEPELGTEAYEAMFRSFALRSKIWQKGGRGYWEDDSDPSQ